MNRKSILAMLTCLMMISSFAASLLPTIVQAQPPLITLWGIRTSDPFWGYYGGYHAIWDAVKTELLKIGIDIKIETMDGFTFDAIFYDDWEIPGDIDGNPATREGWDLATREWWLNPTSHIWFDEMVLSDHVPEWNVMPWINEEADVLYNEALSSIFPNGTRDSVRYKQFMDLWQEEFMHNPPIIANYYQEIMTARAAYLDGYDDTSWIYGLRELRINQTVFDDVAPTARKLVGNDTVIWAASEPIYAWNPFYTLTYTEEAMNVIRLEMLYRNAREVMDYPTSGDFTTYPSLAADDVTWLSEAEKIAAGYDPAETVARMPIRPGIYWSDGVPFNATDVAFTLNAVIDKKAGSFARADYIGVIKEAVVFNATTVDIITYDLRYDLAGYFAHGWAFAMLPWHQFKAWGIDQQPTQWKIHASNFDPIPESLGGAGLEVLGPYVPIASDYPATTFIEFQRFDVATGEPWFWDGLTLPGDTKTWADETPENFIIKIIPDAAARLVALQTLAADFVEYPTAPIETWIGVGADPNDPSTWTAMADWPTHKVNTYEYPASHPLWFNLNNPILSNRYVRLAIAHAIPYQTIYDDILPGWGVANAIPGKTFYTPWNEAFNTVLPPYEYDIAKAQQYMDMYWNSLDENTLPGNGDPAVYNLGPAGDHDLSGLVELADYSVWAIRFGTSPSVYQQYTYPYPIDLTDPNRYLPGLDTDADNDNNDLVELADFSLWAGNFGDEYPFPGAW